MAIQCDDDAHTVADCLHQDSDYLPDPQPGLIDYSNPIFNVRGTAFESKYSSLAGALEERPQRAKPHPETTSDSQVLIRDTHSLPVVVRRVKKLNGSSLRVKENTPNGSVAREPRHPFLACPEKPKVSVPSVHNDAENPPAKLAKPHEETTQPDASDFDIDTPATHKEPLAPISFNSVQKSNKRKRKVTKSDYDPKRPAKIINTRSQTKKLAIPETPSVPVPTRVPPTRKAKMNAKSTTKEAALIVATKGPSSVDGIADQLARTSFSDVEPLPSPQSTPQQTKSASALATQQTQAHSFDLDSAPSPQSSTWQSDFAGATVANLPYQQTRTYPSDFDFFFPYAHLFDEDGLPFPA
ncbi:hypothetical protein ONZ45_g9129 [Pleurotus djamor]|nr:hypothetical protein ONZ45_g9129 [Pleurotus djamor]